MIERVRRETKPEKDIQLSSLLINSELVSDLAKAVYKDRLEADCHGNVARMIEKDKDDGQKLRNRAQSYAPTVKSCLLALIHTDLLDATITYKGNPIAQPRKAPRKAAD